MNPTVILVGYSPCIRGGVTQVTGILLRNLKNINFHVSLYCYSPFGKALILYMYSVVAFFCKIFSNRQFKITHLIVGSSGDSIRIIPYIWLSKIFNLKICIQYHASMNNIFKNYSSNILYEFIVRNMSLADVHCLLSNSLNEEFSSIFADCKSVVIHNALGAEWIDVEILSREERNRDVVFFGRWSREKGVMDLLSCMEYVCGDIQCEIYTDQPPGKTYKNCTIYPWVNELEVIKIMRTAKLLVLPSYSEAYPTVLLEALACGTPFLASDTGGVVDIANESGGGVVCEIGNITKLARLIQDLLADENKWFEMSINGKDWTKTVAEKNIKMQWVNLYKCLNGTVNC